MTVATEPRAQANSAHGMPLASSAAFGAFAIVFAIAGPIVYVVSELGAFPYSLITPAPAASISASPPRGRTKARRCIGMAGLPLP
jgi:hypothetical protein